MTANRICKKIRILFLSLAVGILGLVLGQIWRNILLNFVYQELVLRPDSDIFQQWKKTADPIILNVYMWNWTNPEEIYELNYKPHFVELGPYVFKHYREHVNITFNDNNGTVTYQILQTWFHDEEATNGSLSDEITTVNVVGATLSSQYQEIYVKAVLDNLNKMLKSKEEKIFWKANVSELLFEGFKDGFLSIMSSLPDFNDKFGFFYKSNGSTFNKIFNVDTGLKNLTNIGRLYYLNYENYTDLYPKCPEIEGSAGEFFPPNRPKEEPLQIYMTEFCRKIVYYFTKESMYENLNVYEYSGTKKSMSSKINNCYNCERKKCPSPGIFDISKCVEGNAPVMVSYPHFYAAHSSYIKSIRGMEPVKEKHRTSIYLEPITGLQLRVKIRYQLNVLLKKNSGINLFKDIPDQTYIPMIWMENIMQLKGDTLSKLSIFINVLNYGPFVCYGISFLGFFIFLIVIVRHFCKSLELFIEKVSIL